MSDTKIELEPVMLDKVTGFEILTRCPTLDGTKPTQVHLHLKVDGATIVVRFKNAAGLDALIAGLVEHRADVWGDFREPTPIVYRACECGFEDGIHVHSKGRIVRAKLERRK